MPKATFILFASDIAWHAGTADSLVQISIPASATPDQIATAAAESLKQLGHGAEEDAGGPEKHIDSPAGHLNN